MICKYCQTVMIPEYETNPHNSHRRKGFFTCPQCRAIYEDDVEERGKYVKVFSRFWRNPKTGERE